MPASSEINFIPEVKQDTNNLKDIVFQWVIKNGKRIVIFTQFVVLLVFISRFKFDTDIRNLVNEVESNQTVVESLQPTEEVYLENQKRLGLLKPIIENQIDWGGKLEEFNKKIPTNLTLINANFTPETINLTAETVSPQSFQVFIALLSSDQDVKSVLLKSSEYDKKENIYRFIVQMEL